MSIYNYTNSVAFTQTTVCGSEITMTSVAPSGINRSIISANNSMKVASLINFSKTPASLIVNFTSIYQDQANVTKIITELNSILITQNKKYRVRTLPRLDVGIDVITAFREFITLYSNSLEIPADLASGTIVYLTINIDFLNFEDTPRTEPISLSMKFTIT